jgi:hypothetical protein
LRISHHVVIGAVVALPLAKWSLPGAIGFWVTSILPDIDHFIFYCLHEKRTCYSLQKILSVYKNWGYFGPRIHIFHNYEWLILGLIIASQTGGFGFYLYGGLVLHLVCDQVDTYRLFRYLRVKSLIGDILRYREYVRARDSWWNHLHNKLPPDELNAAKCICDIFSTYPEQPINTAADSSMWQKKF